MIIVSNHLSLIDLVGRWRATNVFVVFVLLFVFVFAFVFLFVFVRICICICIDRLGSPLRCRAIKEKFRRTQTSSNVIHKTKVFTSLITNLFLAIATFLNSATKVTKVFSKVGK